MLTVSTCPTSDLELLCKRYEFPKTFDESLMLKGAKSELADRLTDPSTNGWSGGVEESAKHLRKRARLLRA